MIAGILQAVEGIAAVGVVLLDQEVLSAAGQTGLDAGLQGQVALAQLCKLNGIKSNSTLHPGQTIKCS